MIDGDEILYRVNGKKIEMYHNGKWVESHTGMNYIKNYCTPITEKEAFIEALASPYTEDCKDWDSDEWAKQAAEAIRAEIDRDIIQKMVDIALKEKEKNDTIL